MTFAVPAESPDTVPDSAAAHEKAVDLTMRDRALVSRLLREHQMLHEAFQHSPMPAAIHDSGGALVAWNALYDRLHAEEIAFGVAPRQWTDGPPRECDYGEDGVYRIHDYALPNGATAQVAASLSAEKAREAELEQVAAEAQAANTAKADFLASMSHEIRTPMNGLLGMAGLLAESGLTKGQRIYADVVVRSGEALMAITDDILDLSRIESGRLDLNHASFDIADSVEETATLFAAGADAKGLDLIVRIDPALPCRLIGDESRLRQVVANLLGNAIKFTDTGHILIDLEARMGTRDDGRRVARLTCRVQDTGIGIPPELCGGLFDRFAQTQTGRTRAQDGTGLGLAVVAALLDKMGGTVGVDSVEGEGSTFHFSIELPVDASEITRMASDAVRGKRVLLVDDAAARRTILTESVQAWGFEVASCRGAREAIALMDAMEARGTAVDLVLLGERIAEGEASLFTGALQERPGLLPPVILMARLAALGMCDDDEAAGVVLAATLPRPVQVNRLLASMEQAMRTDPAPRIAPVEDIPHPVAAVPQVPEPEADTPDTAAATDPAPAPDTPDLAPDPATGTGTLDILVAEDNEINQFLIEEILRETGYSYRIVGDGQAALEAWRSDRPRLILMDVSMPVMSGDEASTRIRAEEQGKSRTPIVAVTAHALRGDRERCIRAGMDDHLTKPVTVASIMKVIDFHLQPRDTAASA